MTEPALDPTVFGEMRELMADALGEFIQTYLGNTPTLIQKIELGIAQNNAELIYHGAHQIKGGSGSIGATQLAAMAMEIEKIGKAGSTQGVTDLLKNLKQEYERVATELKSWL